MKEAICQYSFHRRWEAEKWTPDRLAQEVAALGVEGIDFHTQITEAYLDDPKKLLGPVEKHGLTLSGLSFSNNFLTEDTGELRRRIDQVKDWIRIAADLKAPVSRIFGGHLPKEKRADEEVKRRSMQQVIDSVGEVVKEAEARGIVLAIENHGGLPGTADEVVEVITAVGSASLKTTVDVGNFLSVGEEGHEAVAKVAPHAGYVHFKDFKKIPDDSNPWGWKVQACTLGEGDVDLAACCRALREAGYDGFVALEYEGTEDEAEGVPKSLEAMKRVIEESAAD